MGSAYYCTLTIKKWQWNKAGALLNYKDFIQALKLSVESYGFTQQQVAAQMDTVARKAEGLHQAIIKLETGYGGISQTTKTVIDAMRNVLKILDGFSGKDIMTILGMTILLAKSGQIVSAFKSITSAIKGLADTTKGLAGLGGKVKVLLGLATALYTVARGYQEYNDEFNRDMSRIENLQRQQEVETELIARRKQGLELVGTLATAYADLDEKLQDANLSEEDQKKYTDQLIATKETMIGIIGDEGTAEVAKNARSKETIQEVINKENDKIDVQKQNLQTLQGLIQQEVNDMKQMTKEKIESLDEEKVGWLNVAGGIMVYGSVLDGVIYTFHKLKAAISGAIVSTAQFFKELAVGAADNNPFYKLTGTSESVKQTAINYYDPIINWWKESEDNSLAASKLIANETAMGVNNRFRAIYTNSLAATNALIQNRKGGDTDPTGGNAKGSSGSSGSSQKPKGPDGNEINIPNEAGYIVGNGANVSGLTPDTELKLRTLDSMFYNKYGSHLIVTSAQREQRYDGDSSNHVPGLAFDVSGGIVGGDQDQSEQGIEARAWLHNAASYIGLFSMNEYPESPYKRYANGSNMHFSNVVGSDLDQYGGNEGHEAAPSIYSILGESSKRAKFVDNSVQRKVYDTLKSLGFSDMQAWGLMGNIEQESRFDPTLVEDSENPNSGIGIMQWSGARRKALERFAEARQTSWTDLETQLEFLKDEFYGSESRAYGNYLGRNLENTGDAAYWAFNDIERGNPEYAHMEDIRKPAAAKYSQMYMNGVSLRDSNPGKQKVLTPEQRAEERAKQLKEYYSRITKNVQQISKIAKDNASFALQGIDVDESMNGKSAGTINSKVDVSIKKVKNLSDAVKGYKDNIVAISRDLTDKKIGNMFDGMTTDKFLKMSLEDEQKLIASFKSQSALYKPMLETLNAVVENKKLQLEIERDMKKEIAEQNKMKQESLKWTADYFVGVADDKIKRWETLNSNNPYSDEFRNKNEQKLLEQKAQAMKDYYDAIKSDPGSNLDTIRKAELTWLEADAAAKKYSATLKNNVNAQFTEMAKNIFIQGNSIRDYLKNLWKQLAEDALTRLMSGGRQNTGSLLGNLLFGLFGGRSGGSSVMSAGLLGGGASVLDSIAPMPMFAYASGGEIDDEQIAKLGEGNKKEFVVPVEDNKARGISLWQKAGQALGVLGNGTKIEPDIKNKSLSENGVANAQLKQTAVYMDEMRAQNKTLLDILSVMMNQQNGSNDGGTVVQPIVVKQTMGIEEFTAMAQKGKSYGYIK